MEQKNILLDRSFDFAVSIAFLATHLKNEHKAYELAKQVFRSGTAIGALIREARYGESKKDFVHKMHIALKEAHESAYWLDLCLAASFITTVMFEKLKKENIELLKMLTATIKTAKKSIN